MENRNITVVSEGLNKKAVINTGAETLGELKEDIVRAGFDITDMTFFEGISRIELIDDSSLLPRNVMYHGVPTNELKVMVTKKYKKNKLGVDRKELYEKIKGNNLQDEIKTHFGKNFTQVSSKDLEEYLHAVEVDETISDEDSYNYDDEALNRDPISEENERCDAYRKEEDKYTTPIVPKEVVNNAKKVAFDLIYMLNNLGEIPYSLYDLAEQYLKPNYTCDNNGEDAELRDMFDFVSR